ncbi:glycosyltransferase [Bifidobacterium tibiigranuli]|jgi:hypothetical protein|uniref:glycosyltransferase n=1 Tax=Bifidobacterium tibiigranuli TaxID=2172043 RepID=UPI0026ECA744|nr:glycosyltransferase [Bifidobacterium tibiigranuli]MCI1713966.1 hypothetical protein [Bifidobacterium tibiigranuli]
MIKGYYIYAIDENHRQDFGTSGVDRKVQNQIEVMEQHGIVCSLRLVCIPNSITYKMQRSLPVGSNIDLWSSDGIEDADFVYIRKIPLKSDFMKFLQRIRKQNPDALILLEIPTYPYDGEARTVSSHLSLLLDRHYRKYLKLYVNYVVDLFGYEQIFGIPTLHIMNGIPVTTTSMKKPSGNINDLRMVCAASFDFWHGIDRLLEGISKYKERGGQRQVHLTLIGQGTDQINRQVQHLRLEQEVTVIGPTDSNRLMQYYNQCNMGVESLARFRSHNTSLNSSLKSRDYLNSGLPFFGEGMVDVFNNREYPYYYQVPSDDTPIDMEEIFKFFDSIYLNSTEEDVISRIHNFARNEVDMSVTFSNVIQAIRDN